MQIKKYEAVDMPSAIRMIKSELGSDAVILSTRNIRKGKGAFGIFGRSMVEVTAAVDPETGQGRERTFDQHLSSSAQTPVRLQDLPRWVLPLKHELHEIKEGMESLQVTKQESPEIPRLLEEMRSFKEILRDSLDSDQGQKTEDCPVTLKKMGSLLVEQDVDPRIVERLLGGIQKRLPRGSYDSEAKVERTLRSILQNILRVQNGIRLDGKGPKKVALVGPTGVGKTTTLAKIAAHYALTENRKVALVTVDTYRIAAIEQLKIYAKIIGIPVDVVVHEEDMERVFQKHDDKELILIDTAGRSHRNLRQMKELRGLFVGQQDIEKHLVLSMTTKQSDMTSILRTFKPMDFHYLLFTKIDEGSRFGTVLNAVLESGKFVSYLTDGQRVPEDIREARMAELMELILGSKRG